ncbi:C39 family peptidase [Staphylococcus carnosus]|uniref:C39 family peptidase n=1 Tax=Staphylococcus carnosus TaxID=1281 RepID=UPI00081AB1F0|nr:C39 family peptidase [Staphylococcus carnosus]ANZ32591.1 hypothetical protein BEK99_01465 [Staphylococcus carnosus]UTB84719.1 hypothetical protein A2I66_03075 [Staphylococcus carnosus]
MSKKILDVKPKSQLSPIPMVMGCEGTAASMLLNYNHIYVHPFSLMKRWPKHPSNPNKGYVGHFLMIKPGAHQTIFPAAFAPYLQLYDTKIVDGTGTTLEELETLIHKGQPALIYHTVLGQTPHKRTFKVDSGREEWVSNIHITLLVGYDDDYYYYIDPLWSQFGEKLILPALFPSKFQTIKIPKDKMKESYDSVGRLAIYHKSQS